MYYLCTLICLFIMAEQRQQLVEELKNLLEQDVMAVKDQVEHLKTQFYRGAEEEDEEVEGGKRKVEGEVEGDVEGEEEAAPKVLDEVEEQFKALLAEYKAKRAAVAAEQAKEQEDNLARKQAILDEMAKMVEGATADGVMANLQRMRDLQATWKTIGAVPATKTQEIRKAYQQYQEQFYDLVKINIELRDLDFKKNLELKTLLCEAAERLQNNPNIVEASRSLQQLHDEWAEIGPVARELREDLWNRFKTASSVINKKHQAYFDELHAKEVENLTRKKEIIEQLKALNEPVVAEAKIGAKQWEELTQKIQELQAEWRKIGFAPKKHNQAVYDEYRAECERFFKAKTAYFKGIRDTFGDNLKHKRSLVSQAKEVVANLQQQIAEGETTREFWDAATKQVIALQNEWKTVGAVTRKHSNELWQQFSEACDAFFNAKREAFKEAKEQSRKSKAAKVIRDAANQGAEKLWRVRDRLQQEIKTAENNILFFTAKSKTANKLVDSMQKKIDELKKQLAEIQERLDNEEE